MSMWQWVQNIDLFARHHRSSRAHRDAPVLGLRAHPRSIWIALALWNGFHVGVFYFWTLFVPVWLNTHALAVSGSLVGTAIWLSAPIHRYERRNV